MITYIIMLIISAFLGYLLLVRDKDNEENTFFDIRTTNTMRGFWCLIVVLVHIPAGYQNIIQDLWGSFAYIGVSFFFMTSGYGLMLSVQGSNQKGAYCFWKRRLTKLLIPMVLTNLLNVAMNYLVAGVFTFSDILSLNGFVKQLILYYAVFWGIISLPNKTVTIGKRVSMVAVGIIAISVTIYMTKNTYKWGWPVETLGFLYGILLARNKDKFVPFVQHRWWIKCLLSCCCALVLGVLYLKFKTVVFWGDYIIKVLLGQSIIIFLLVINSGYVIGNKAGNYLGKISYEIYLLHGLVFTYVELIPIKLNSGVFILVGIIITVILSTGIHSIAKRMIDALEVSLCLKNSTAL